MTAAVDRAAAELAAAIGLRNDATSRPRLERALREAAAARGEPVAEYAARLGSDRAELQRLIDAVTVPETAFFRDPAHFEVLTARALPRLGAQGVVWCAGCAHGPEAWSLAMALEEGGFGGWTVLATDVARGPLTRAATGRYTEGEISGLDAARRSRFLRRGRGGAWEILPRLRERVSVRPHNLAADPPPPEAGACPVVFCRNVLMYFDASTQDRVLAGLRRRMREDGWLFLGASESLPAGPVHFAAERAEGAIAYRPRPRDRPWTPERASPARRRPAEPEADAAALTASGERHAAAGRHDEAVAAFRRAAALTPADPLGHLRLALALERSGAAPAATAAFMAARAALERAGHGRVEPGLEGWSAAELERLLAERLG